MYTHVYIYMCIYTQIHIQNRKWEGIRMAHYRKSNMKKSITGGTKNQKLYRT